MPETKYCARHSGVSTNVRCGRCSTLVCPQCMVHAPVGVRCQDCGKSNKSPTYDVPPKDLTKAVLVSVFLGVLGGGLAVLLVRPLFFGLFYLVALGGFGYVVGEAISASANRKRGRFLQVVAAGGVLVALLVIALLPNSLGGGLSIFDLLGGALGIYVAAMRLR